MVLIYISDKRRRKKQSQEEAIAKARLARRNRYAKLKEDPALYALEKEKDKQRYIKRKKEKRVLSVSEMTPLARELQRKKWRENYRKYQQRKLLKKESTDEYIIPVLDEEVTDEYIIPVSTNEGNVDDDNSYELIIWGGYGNDIKRRL